MRQKIFLLPTILLIALSIGLTYAGSRRPGARPPVGPPPGVAPRHAPASISSDFSSNTHRSTHHRRDHFWETSESRATTTATSEGSHSSHTSTTPKSTSWANRSTQRAKRGTEPDLTSTKPSAPHHLIGDPPTWGGYLGTFLRATNYEYDARPLLAGEVRVYTGPYQFSYGANCTGIWGQWVINWNPSTGLVREVFYYIIQGIDPSNIYWYLYPTQTNKGTIAALDSHIPLSLSTDPRTGQLTLSQGGLEPNNGDPGLIYNSPQTTMPGSSVSEPNLITGSLLVDGSAADASPGAQSPARDPSTGQSYLPVSTHLVQSDQGTLVSLTSFSPDDFSDTGYLSVASQSALPGNVNEGSQVAENSYFEYGTVTSSLTTPLTGLADAAAFTALSEEPVLQKSEPLPGFAGLSPIGLPSDSGSVVERLSISNTQPTESGLPEIQLFPETTERSTASSSQGTSVAALYPTEGYRTETDTNAESGGTKDAGGGKSSAAQDSGVTGLLALLAVLVLLLVGVGSLKKDELVPVVVPGMGGSSVDSSASTPEGMSGSIREPDLATVQGMESTDASTLGPGVYLQGADLYHLMVPGSDRPDSEMTWVDEPPKSTFLTSSEDDPSPSKFVLTDEPVNFVSVETSIHREPPVSQSQATSSSGSSSAGPGIPLGQVSGTFFTQGMTTHEAIAIATHYGSSGGSSDSGQSDNYHIPSNLNSQNNAGGSGNDGSSDGNSGTDYYSFINELAGIYEQEGFSDYAHFIGGFSSLSDEGDSTDYYGSFDDDYSDAPDYPDSSGTSDFTPGYDLAADDSDYDFGSFFDGDMDLSDLQDRLEGLGLGLDLTGDSDEDFSDYEDEFYDSFSESDDGEEDEEEPEAVRDSDRDYESDPRIERGSSDSGETSAPLSDVLSDFAKGLPFYTPSLEEKVSDLFNGVDPAGLGNPALVQQLSDYLEQDLGFSDSEAQNLAEEFADGLQFLSDANQGDSDSSSNGSDSSGSDVQGSGADTSDAGSAPGTDTTGKYGTIGEEDKPIQEDEAFFWGTVAGLWTIFSGAGVAAIGAIGTALTWVGTALAEAWATASAWAEGALYNIGQRLGSAWQSVLNFFRAEGSAIGNQVTVDLQAMETAGGHTIANHVGLSVQDLMARLASRPSLNYASSFYDLATAESAVGQTIAANGGRISTWLQGNQTWLKMTYDVGSDVGIEMAQGSSIAQSCSKVTVILMRDASSLGYYVNTAYVKP